MKTNKKKLYLHIVPFLSKNACQLHENQISAQTHFLDEIHEHSLHKTQPLQPLPLILLHFCSPSSYTSLKAT